MCWTIFVLYLHKGSEYFSHHCFTVGRPKQSQRWSVFSFNLHPSDQRRTATGEPQDRHTSEDVTVQLNLCLLVPHSQQNGL